MGLPADWPTMEAPSRATPKLTVAYCTFRDNVAPHNGGAINHGSSALTVHHSTFVHNSARFGGAMSVSGGANISNSTFSQNHADWAGGAMVFDGISAPSSTLTNVTIY